MKALKLTITAAAIVTLAGCAAKQDITRFEGNSAPKIVCIAEHKEVREGVITALQTGFAKHNVQTRVIPANYVVKHQEYQTDLLGADTTDCQAIAYYVANWRWDLALYMAYANIWVNDAKTNEKIAQASYRTGGGLDKFIDAKEKIIELVDGMY
ncbi:Sbal_3080 family lipoprotein [Pseudoalteromonas sp.]|uniref:Sbal_3080 family lipoprotein n=1 Tax=Pseudoalteromonas sp. TaxID=53249 RepID=UPI0035685009